MYLRKSILVVAAIVWPLITGISVFGDLPEVVVLDLKVTQLPKGGQILEIGATAANDNVTRAAIEVETKGDFLVPDVTRRPVTLVPGHAFTVTIPLRPSGSGELGVATVRLLDHASGEPLVVRVFHLGGAPDAARVLSDEEVGQIIDRQNMAHRRSNIRVMVDDLALRTAVHGVPMRIEAHGASAAEQATDAIRDEPSSPRRVQSQSRPSAVKAHTCGVFDIISPNNNTYTVNATVDYYDEYLGGRYTTGYGGYSLEIKTLVEFTDGCGATQVLQKAWGPALTPTGLFSIPNVKSIVSAPGNPVVSLKVTFDKTGTATSSHDLLQGSLSLFNQSDFPVDWTTSSGPTVRAYFTSSNAFASYYFRWNEGTLLSETLLKNDGLAASKQPVFRAAYNSSYTSSLAAAYTFNPPGLVEYGPNGKWASRWLSGHEFGHLLQYKLQGGLNGGGTHYVCTSSDADVGFVEGFADWHASRYSSQGRSVYFPNCTNSDCPPCSTAGYSVEGNVQSFFWDVFDSVNHANDSGADTIWYPISRLGDMNRTYDDFLDFYQDWTNRGLWGTYQSVVDSLRPLCNVSTP